MLTNKIAPLNCYLPKAINILFVCLPLDASRIWPATSLGRSKLLVGVAGRGCAAGGARLIQTPHMLLLQTHSCRCMAYFLLRRRVDLQRQSDRLPDSAKTAGTRRDRSAARRSNWKVIYPPFRSPPCFTVVFLFSTISVASITSFVVAFLIPTLIPPLMSLKNHPFNEHPHNDSPNTEAC